MAELYDQNKIYANRPTASSQAPQSADAELEAMLAELPPEERETARAKITAPPTGEDIYKVMQERNANGEVFNMNLDQYRQYKAYVKTKEVDVLDAMGTAAEGVFNEIMAAAGSIADKPLESTAKLTPSLVEAFAQGTRSLYGMAAQSQDPNSAFFRVKNALLANGDDEQAEFQQFMDAQAFNVQSMKLATGQETWIMDKDLINPEVTQVMSYIADPTLFVPFGGIAAKGARMIGMGEGLAKASARAAQIQRKVLGGAIKWGVGAPIEFLGTATRNTIDYGLERAGAAFEVATGMPAAEARTTAQMYGWYTASAALEGRNVPFPIFGDVAGAMVGSTTARGIGESLTMVGEQMQKQQQFGRGVLSYAGQALRDANKSGVPLSKHAKALLNVLDKVDPLFVYSADISKGAAEGMAIGAGLGYLSAGEEGAASGAGAGMALGAAGAGMGAVVADVGNGRLYDRIAVQRQMVIEGLRQIDPEKAAAFEALVKTAEISGNRDVIAQVDGIITGIDVMAPDAKVVARDADAHIEWLRSQKIDPDTGRLMEPLALFPEFGTDRKSRAKALSFLSMLGNRFDGDHKLLIKELQGLPQDHSLRKQFMRLSEEQKKSVFDAIDKAATPEFKEKFGGKNGYEFYGDLNYAEANVARVNAMFDAGNKTQANEMIRQFLKDETGKDGKLSARGELLKQKLATEGYFDKDGNMRPSRLKDVEMTAKEFKNAKGFVFRRDSTGQVELHINLKEFGKETLPHELFHAVMLDSVLKPDFIDRLSQNLLGKFDADGKRIENASVDIKQVRQFFQRYIDALHGKNSEEAKNETARLEAAMKEYESRGTTNKIALDTKNTLEGLLEEFGAYYFGAFINDKPVDFLFRGGELGAMREIMGNAKQGFLDFWRSKIKGMNPDFNFDPATNEYIFQAFEKEGVRTKNKSLDLLMRDFVRATAMANKQGGFDVSRLSPAARETFIKNNGIRGLSMTRDANGNLVRSPQRKVIQEQMRVGKEIYKILSGLDPKFRQGLITDGEGNLSGRLSPEAMEAIVQSGHVDRAWVDKIQQAYNILDGKGGNVIHFGYLGRTAQIGDYAWPRLVGSDVPFKNRQAVLLGVDFKVGKDGKMYSLFHTLDKAVIDGRADVLWSDSAVRTLWNGDRGAMEADFFRYLANASKAAGDSSRVESAILLEDGTGAGARRRDVLHQMLGMVKAEGDVYLNKPIAEIPYGIRHSVTTFNVDGIANMRVGTDRWNVVPENAFKDLSRNFQPSEMAREDTPNGAIIKHPLGYKFAEKNGKVRAFDDQGNTIGVFDGIQQAAEAAQKHSVKQKQELIKSANDYTTEQFNQGRKFQVLEKGERDEAVRLGDVFEVLKVKRFTEGTNVIRQSRDEYVLDRAERELVAGSTAFYERLIRNAGEEMVNALEAEERFTSAANALTEGISRLEQATAENNLRLKRGEITNEEYNSIGTAIFNDYKNLVKQKDSAGDAYNKYRGQNFNMLSVFLEAGAEGDWKQQIRNGEFPKLTDEGLEKLNQFARKHIEQYRTNAVQGLPETISALYSDEYNQQFKTGEAFTTVATHGTKSLDLMVAREFSRSKLGTSFNIFSSLNAVFSAGQESTGVRYAQLATQSGQPLSIIIGNYSPEFISAKNDLNVNVGHLVDTILHLYYKETFVPKYEEFKARFKFSTDEAARKAYEMNKNEFRVINGQIVSLSRFNEAFNLIFGKKLESPETKGMIHNTVSNYFGQSFAEVIGSKNEQKISEAIVKVRRELIRRALDLGTPENTVYNTFGEFSIDYSQLEHQGGKGAARLISDSYSHLEMAMKTIGYSLSDLFIDPAVKDSSSAYYEGVRNSVDANLNRIIGETKRVPMEVRTLVKMNNPLVIEGRKEYGEYYLKDIMEPAMKAGHDGVVFRNMRDGGKYDNIYAVFKDYMDSNLMIIDTSFDDVKMPRGKDSEGNPVRYGRELGLRNQPTEGAEGGRVYDQNSNEFKFNFIGKQAEENQDLIQDKNLEFVKRKDGSYRITLTDNGEGYNTRKIGHITATIDDASVVAGEGAAEISSNIDPKYRGQKLANILYSEMAERLRSMGIKYVDGTIVNTDGIPVQVRNTVIGQTYYQGKNTPAFREDVAKKVKALQSVGLRQGVGVYNILDPKARYQPTEGEQVSYKARYDIDEAIVAKLKEKFKGYRNLTAKDMLEFIVENKGQFSPLAERLLESLDKHGLEAFVQQQTATLGAKQKGTKGRDYHNYNPNNNTVNMLLERNVQRRRGWTLSFEELMIEEILHAVSAEKVPEPIKHGVTIEDTSKTVDHFLRNKEKYSLKYNETWKTELGFSEEWFTIADAYKQVLKQFETGKFSDGTVIDKTAAHHMSYRLSNMAEFIVGITQDKDIQKVLSQIKAPKSEKSLLVKILDAIKRIWNFDDSVMDSLLAVTSDAAERIIQREKTQMEKVGSGIFRDRAKQYFSGMPEARYQPTEGFKPREEVVRRAKEAGYKPTVYYHGTPKQFTEFKSDAGRTMGGREGATAGYFFFTPLKDEAKGIHGSDAENATNVMQVFLKYENPFNTGYGKTPLFTEKQKARIIDFYRENANYAGSRDYLADVVEGYLNRRDLASTFKYLTRQKRAELLQSLGYDSLIDKGNHIVVFNPEQIKSADDFTYDDSGKEIPLEERFNKNKKDIRFQPSEYRGDDDYYKPKKNIFEYRDGEGLLVRRPFVGNDEITGDKNARGHQVNPADYNVDWVDIGHYGQVRETKALNMWELQNSGLWADDPQKGILTKNPALQDNTGYTHSEWFQRYQYDEDKPPVYGRYEKPRIVDGVLKERGKLSITTRYSDHFNSMAEVYKYKEMVAKKLGVNPEYIDAYYFGGNSEIKRSMGLSEKDNLPIKFQPTEGEQGGRVYSDEQFNQEFIGKFASENPEIANKFFIRIKENDGGTLEDWDYKMVIYDKDTKKAVARTKWQIFENDDGIAEDAAADVEILNNAYKGMKLSHLMQSERLERSRFLGAEKVRSQITNEEGIPIKNYAKTIGADKGEITSSFAERYNEDGTTKYIPATMENFKQEMDLSKANADGTWKPTVYYRANLDPKAWYQPTEQRRVNYSSNDERVKYLMSVIDNVPHYKRAFDSGQLSIDAYKPEEFKDFDVLSHAPDTASTVEQKDFKAQGGVGYPLLFPEEGWAAVSRGLEKRLNAIGQKNFEKHGKWIAPMALVLSHAQKMQGARNGTEGFLNIIKRLEDRKVITNETLKAALIHGLKSIGTDINDNAQIGDAMFATYKMLENSTSSGFKQRAKFVSNVAGSIARNTGNLSKRQINTLKEIIPNYTGNKTITKKELIPTIFQMFADPLVQGLDAPDKKTGGDVYAFVLFDKPLVESPSSPHGSYKYSVRHEDNSPVRVDLLSRPMKTLEMFKEKRTNKGVSELKEKTITNDTGQRNFPYGRVIHAQPSEAFSNFQTERTPTGVLLKNAAGYVISRVGSKYRVYNPYKAVIGVFDSEEQAKKRIYKEEPRR